MKASTPCPPSCEAMAKEKVVETLGLGPCVAADEGTSGKTCPSRSTARW